MDDDELLTAGAVARRLGVAVTTLRSWHQRYGLGPTGHEPGQHRRYTTGDLGRLEHMQRLVAEGVPAKEAARWALRAPVPTTSDQSGPRSPAGRPGPVAHRDGGPGLALGRAGAGEAGRPQEPAAQRPAAASRATASVRVPGVATPGGTAVQPGPPAATTVGRRGWASSADS